MYPLSQSARDSTLLRHAKELIQPLFTHPQQRFAFPSLSGVALNSPPGLGGLRGLGSYAAYSLGWDPELPPTFPVSRQSTNDYQFAAPAVRTADESSLSLSPPAQIESISLCSRVSVALR